MGIKVTVTPAGKLAAKNIFIGALATYAGLGLGMLVFKKKGN